MNSCEIFSEHCKPTDKVFEQAVGRSAAAWRKLRLYLKENYSFQPELFYDKKNALWFIRYRKSGKTLCTLNPGKNAFTTLIVLGKKEVEKAKAIEEKLSEDARTLLNRTEQLHDGRWLWIETKSVKDVKDIQVLLTAKRKPLKN